MIRIRGRVGFSGGEFYLFCFVFQLFAIIPGVRRWAVCVLLGVVLAQG